MAPTLNKDNNSLPYIPMALLMSFHISPRVPWMLSSSSQRVADTRDQERAPAMTRSANTESRGEPESVTSYPLQAILTPGPW